MPRLPYIPLYTGDWLKDPGLRRCSQAARGVWIDLLCFMFDCEERGVLASGGVPWTNEEVSRVVAGDSNLTITCLTELLGAGVVSRNGSGALFSRRMVRDEENRAKDRKRQQKCREVESSHATVTVLVTPLSDNDIEVLDSDSKDSKAFELQEAFERFWTAYPVGRKFDKKKAFATWKRLKPDGLQALLSLSKWKECKQWQDPNLIPHLSTFLNQERWKAHPPAEGSKGDDFNARFDAIAKKYAK